MSIDRLRQLEAVSRTLDPGPEERSATRDAVVTRAEDFLRSLPSAPAYVPGEDGVAALRELGVAESPRDADAVLAALMRGIRPGVNAASSRMLAYIPGGGLHSAALGDYLAAVTNRYAGVRFASPGAVEIEEGLLAWMAELVGFPRSSGGNLTSGGSVGNLIAVVTAREAAGLRGSDLPRAPVYLAASTHHSLRKALRIAGLGECPVRTIAVDDRQRLDAAALAGALRADRTAGMKPFLVVATAGTTDAGAIDPLPAIAAAAREAGAWLHVDAAYGGFFALVPSCSDRLAGLSLADSIVLDPHKGLFLPYGTGAVLVRDREAMRRAHADTADYLAGTGAGSGASPADLSPELTKHWRGLRLWLPLQLHGLAAFRACLEEKLLLARHFHARIVAKGFPALEPELSVVAFSHPEGEAATDRLAAELQADGRAILTGTKLSGRSVLRLAVLAFRTHLADVDEVLALILDKARDVG